jgi:ATP-dependent DNA ligase
MACASLIRLAAGRQLIFPVMVLRAASSAFIPPCLPSPAERPPSGPGWIHEIKHDGFRIIARKNDERMRLYSRPGNASVVASR